MDINETLRRLRELINEIDSYDGIEMERAAELVETFRALDQWLARGGFLPRDWAVAR